jgi:hypothetical protein
MLRTLLGVTIVGVLLDPADTFAQACQFGPISADKASSGAKPRRKTMSALRHLYGPKWLAAAGRNGNRPFWGQRSIPGRGERPLGAASSGLAYGRSGNWDKRHRPQPSLALRKGQVSRRAHGPAVYVGCVAGAAWRIEVRPDLGPRQLRVSTSHDGRGLDSIPAPRGPAVC